VDVAAPQRHGMTGIWVDAPGNGLPPTSEVTPHRIIRHIRELVVDG
jgi:FMN phosphatase YigB (HAD superfamily)